MELYQLRGFAAVAEHGQLTRAADALHLSQPALSAQIKALEDELGLALFERRPAGMELTAAGRQLLDEARRVIAAAQSMRSRARVLGNEVQGMVRMGTLADPTFVRLPQVLLGAASRFPLLDIEIVHLTTGDPLERVRSGALDASFHCGEPADPALEALLLRRFDYVVVAPRAWAGRLQGATFADLATHPWILTPPDSTLRSLCDAQFARSGVSPAGRVSADNEQVVRSLVVAGVGLALLRDDDAHALARKGEVALWEGETLPCSLQFVWDEARGDEPALRALLELVEAAWDGGAAQPVPQLRRRRGGSARRAGR